MKMTEGVSPTSAAEILRRLKFNGGSCQERTWGFLGSSSRRTVLGFQLGLLPALERRGRTDGEGESLE